MKLWRLEAVRGLAAVYIVISHVLGNGYFFLRFGQEAVMVFFLMSGFVIEYSFQNNRYQSFKNYFLKRVLRIYPVLILMFITAILIQRPNLADPKFWQTLLGNLLMLQDFKSGKPNVIVSTLFASALWSLHYQWWHYMLYYPVKRLLSTKKQGFFVGIAGIASTVLYLFYPNAILRILIYFPVWWAGVEMARSFLKYKAVRWKDLQFSVFVLIVIDGILIVNAYQFIEQGNVYTLGIHPILEARHLAAALLTILLSLLWQKVRWFGFGLLKFGALFAPISYSLYIAHQPLLANSHYLDFINNVVVEKLLCAVVLFLFCYFAEIKFSAFLSAKIKHASRGIHPIQATYK